MIEIDL